MGKQELVDRLQRELAAVKRERQGAAAEPTLAASRAALKRYQAARLASTHADLLQAPDSARAARFFLDELYGAHDLSQRDVDLERIIPTLQRMLPYEPLHAITEAIVLDALTEKLDSAMARVLGPEFGAARYAEAFRTSAPRAERERQLDLVETLGRSLCKLVRIPMLSATLSLMGQPARLTGLGGLHHFLLSGFTSFRDMREPMRFIDTVIARERQLMAHIYSGSGRPFSLTGGA